ncbi:MAG: hypothetical protein AAGK17_02995 [Pseudomonadota bacterium]
MKNGSIVAVTSAVPNLESALHDYVGRLGLKVVQEGPVSKADALSWDAPKITGNRSAMLQPKSGANSFIRLIEQPLPDGFKATRTYGWAAFELTVEDAFQWPDKLEGSGFDIVGPPRHIAGLEHLIAMQMVGTGQEMLYLNEIRDNTPTTDLPKAQSPVDKTFICILAAQDIDHAVRWYCDKLSLDESESHTIPYSSINRAFDLPADTQTKLTMIHDGRVPIIEVDHYPDIATQRVVQEGFLPPGNAIVSLAVRDLAAVPLAPITPITTIQFGSGEERRCACYRGAEGELLELIEWPET